ncbi:MAG: S-layer homology domain-containing protein [Clostridia bacterium]|nr:S-layer homology domain-containing protein [Clostridia bacterium]
MKRILTIIICITMIMSHTVFAFDDTNSVVWAEDAIEKLADAGVINGYEDGTFKPNNNVTRAEFAKMLCLAFDFDSAGADVDFEFDTNHWAGDWILRTANVMYTPGKAYEPDRSATRAEIAYSLAKVLGFEASNADMNGMFSDWESVDEKIAPFVASGVEHGIIEGYENDEIRGDNPVTRAEAAVLIVRALDYEAQLSTPGQIEDEPVAAPEDDENVTDDKDDIFEGLDHIFTVYPYEDLFIVTDSATVISEKSGDVAYKLTYKKAGGETKVYTSVIEEDDAKVIGCKTDLSQIAPGDVFIIDMTFLTHIDNICVLTSFGGGFDNFLSSSVIPINGERLGAYDSGAEYEFLYGELVEKKVKTNTIALTLKNNSGTFMVNVLKSVDADIFENGRKKRWEFDSVISLDEGSAVYVRLSKGRVTEVIAEYY